jgi:CheY-like chemotaxis protein
MSLGAIFMEMAILIVDDSTDDAAFIKRGVLSLRPKSPVRTVTSSRELRQYLDGTDSYADRSAFPYPGLILLDLRMPEVSGFEVLDWLKRDLRHAEIPVIVVSSVDRQVDIRKSYELGACTFLSKPFNPVSFRGSVRSLMLPVEFSD